MIWNDIKVGGFYQLKTGEKVLVKNCLTGSTMADIKKHRFEVWEQNSQEGYFVSARQILMPVKE